MRGLVAVCLTLAVAALSGCVELVEDPSEADLDAAAQEANRQLDEMTETVGHIAGTVTGTEGVPLAGALIDLAGVEDDRSTDSQGRFTFIDLAPGLYSVVVDAEEYVTAQLEVEVLAGQFSRLDIPLQAAPPEPYFEVYRFDGYMDSLYPFSWCECYFEAPINEGFIDAVLEGELYSNSLFGSDSFHYSIDNYGYEGDGMVAGSEQSPMSVRVTAEELGPGTGVSIHLQPEDYLPDVNFGTSFTGYFTAFYHEAGPEDWTAVDVE